MSELVRILVEITLFLLWISNWAMRKDVEWQRDVYKEYFERTQREIVK